MFELKVLQERMLRNLCLCSTDCRKIGIRVDEKLGRPVSFSSGGIDKELFTLKCGKSGPTLTN